MTGRDRRLAEQYEADLRRLAAVARELRPALRAAAQDSSGVGARRYDAITVRNGGAPGDPTSGAALYGRDEFAERRQAVEHHLEQLHHAAVVLTAEVERLRDAGRSARV